MLPESCVAEEFDIDERVWAAKYNTIAIIKKNVIAHGVNYKEIYDSKMYQIFVITMTDFDTKYFGYQKIGGFWSHALAYDLGSLRHLKEYGIDIYK
jgi:hypothetical protein